MDPPGLPSFLRVARKAGTEPRARNRFPAGHLSVFGLYLPVFVDELRTGPQTKKFSLGPTTNRRDLPPETGLSWGGRGK